MTHMARTSPTTIVPLPLGTLDERPLVSILTSNFNYAAYVGEAIESVLAQTYPHFEMIVVDDGSTDDSVARIRRYTESDPRIQLISKENGGQASAWNRAYEHSHGSIICILDSDDLFVPHKLEQVVAAFQHHHDAGLLIHPVHAINNNKEILWQIPRSPEFETGWIGPEVLRRGGKWRAMFGSALCLRREVADIVFPVPETIGPAHADSYVVRIGPLLTPVTSLLEPLVLYRFHEENVTNDHGRSMDPDFLRAWAERIHQTALGVNARLAEAGLADRTLPIRHDARMAYWICLSEPSSLRNRAALLKPLLAEVVEEQQISMTKRVGKLLIYSAALVLPRESRTRLMSRFFSLRAHSIRGSRYGDLRSLQWLTPRATAARAGR